VSLSIYSCSNKTDNNQNDISVLNDSLVVIPDTFKVPDLMMYPSLPDDVFWDTIDIARNKKHTGINIVIPRLSQKNFPEINKRIKTIVENKKEEFNETISDDRVGYDSGIDSYRGWSMWIEPKSLYFTKNVISFAMETGSGYTGMPSGFEFKTINFDLDQKHEIKFDDFFDMETTSDSAFWGMIIRRSMGREPIKNMREFLELHGPINFAFDSNNIYFFFDKYDVFGWGISGVQRKYINHMIKERYR
jgi:hypothetical protein